MTATHSSVGPCCALASGDWLSALRRYLIFIAAGNLIWALAHMSLYTLWETGSAGEIGTRRH